VAQALRELESTARAQQAAARERAQQAARQDIAEKSEAADRVAAEIMGEEEREQTAPAAKVRPSAPPARIIGLSTEEPAVQAAEGTTGAQQTEPEPEPAGSTKKDKERLRKERQRKMDEAWIERWRGWRRLRAAWTRRRRRCRLRPSTTVAASRWRRWLRKREACSSRPEQARAAEAERAKVVAEEAAVKAAVEAVAVAEAAAERLQLEERLAALALGMQRDALEVQQVHARLGSSIVPPAAPAPHPGAEEAMCAVSFDAPKEYIIVPCGHQCVCGACAEQLTKTRTPMCPVCRGPIRETMKVFCS
jgi:hypothetical protein